MGWARLPGALRPCPLTPPLGGLRAWPFLLLSPWIWGWGNHSLAWVFPRQPQRAGSQLSLGPRRGQRLKGSLNRAGSGPKRAVRDGKLTSENQAAPCGAEQSTAGSGCGQWAPVPAQLLPARALGHRSRVRLFPTLWSPPGSPVRGILQARLLGWVATSPSRGIFPTQGSNPRPLGSCITGATGKVLPAGDPTHQLLVVTGTRAPRQGPG